MSIDDPYLSSYCDVLVHKTMLIDVVRTEAYERALRRVVKPGLTVLDFGCGTGVLSIFASRSGAKKVFAVDRSAFIKVAYAIAEVNGIDNISFFHDDHKSLELDERVDLIVSECMGHFMFFETMLGPLLQVRDRFLAPGGIMVPEQVTLYAGLVCDESLFEDRSFFRQNPYGIDFSPIAEAPLYQTSLEFMRPEQILDTIVKLGTLDLGTLKSPPLELTGTAVPREAATAYGLAGWFNAKLTDGIELGTGPNDSPTHWNQIFFPFAEPFAVSPDRELTVSVAPPEENELLDFTWRWSISDGSRSIEMNDYLYRDRLRRDVEQGLLEKLPR
jgi:SAM-dependent methyltransferase